LGGTFVLVSAVRSLLASHLHVGEVESALVIAEGESAKRAGRIRALWEMASQGGTSDEERSQRVLEIAANALRPNKSMRAYLSHLEGQTLVVDATSWKPSDVPATGLAEIIFPGAALHIDRTILSLVAVAKRTLYWDDLRVLERRGMFWEQLGWRSAIVSSVTVSDRPHFVLFFSHELMTDQPYAEDDIAYVDVVTSFFANRFTQQLQFDQLQYAVEHDALTGLGNRIQFRQMIRDDIRIGRPFTIAFANIDDFRRLNEREGHSIGDEVLVEIAAALTAVSPSDFVARMSGDEFGIIMRGFGSPAKAMVGLERYANVFRSAFHGGALEESHAIVVGASLGAARFPDDGNTGEELMRRAGVALDVAKTRGGSTALIFDEPMQMILDDQRVRVAELADAAAHDHFALVYQPTFALATREITGAEALIRWDHPERGRLAPSEFIPFAERNGMIASISRWVLHRLVNEISAVNLPAGFRIYFNLAAEMLDDIPFIAELSDALRLVPKLVDHLGIEVTETAAMQNVERSMHTIDLLRGWGFSVAIDDFGTGYSSLSYLKRLTVDMIKIDRSFVVGIPFDERDAALTEMLLRITDRFGFATLAEGIETEEQAAWLAEKGCRFGQGYLVAKPGTLEDLLQRIDVRTATV
jgi:diguanylate cyclase (GGDEF)-like protein